MVLASSAVKWRMDTQTSSMLWVVVVRTVIKRSRRQGRQDTPIVGVRPAALFPSSTIKGAADIMSGEKNPKGSENDDNDSE
jgi:hypothetical protein